jgi:hypothetical protein
VIAHLQPAALTRQYCWDPTAAVSGLAFEAIAADRTHKVSRNFQIQFY